MESKIRNYSLPGRIASIVLFLILWMSCSAIVSEASGKPLSVGIASVYLSVTAGLEGLLIMALAGETNP
ncbi:MAG: hypothetical protein IKZ43_08150 [Acidaminococcaceae bacterium]|nr:hypothetical protein [Acidaminococcaceae bacterium]